MEISEAQIEHLERKIDALQNASHVTPASISPKKYPDPAAVPTQQSNTAASQLQQRIACLEGNASALAALKEQELIHLIETQNRALQESQRLSMSPLLTDMSSPPLRCVVGGARAEYAGAAGGAGTPAVHATWR